MKTMKKIAFIGAGSFGFTRELVKDILTFDAFKDVKISLMDINEERLNAIEKAVNKIKAAGQYPCTVEATTDRAKALSGADGVIITILNGDIGTWRHDIEIPKKYGVDINVGDTRGPSGIFRFLRTAPVMLSICRDIEKYCPDAVVLNYTNPMAMLCRYLQQHTKLNITGLCHSVQGTAMMLADWIKADFKDIKYTCAGINHQAWYLKFEYKGKDAYPLIKKAIIENFDIYNREIVRNDMFLALDYYVTESSGHNSEYVQWYRKRPDLIEKYCKYGTGWNPGEHAFILNEYLRREKEWKKDITDWLDQKEVNLARGREYAAHIFNAAFGDNTPYQFNGNIRNDGYIGNLPQGACVEVPVTVGKGGAMKAEKIGLLPAHLALINNILAGCEELAVAALTEGDLRKVYYAILNDPLTSAVLSLEEIKAMTDEMIHANMPFFAENKSFRL